MIRNVSRILLLLAIDAALIGTVRAKIIVDDIFPEPRPADNGTHVEGNKTKPKQEKKRARRSVRPLTFELSNSYVFDSNINRDNVDPKDVMAVVFGAAARYQKPSNMSNLDIKYEIGRHFYPEVAGGRDRVSHHFRLAWDRRLDRRWEFETVGEISFKGSTEDRDVSNTFLLSPRIEYRFTRQNRLRLYGAYRIRRFPNPNLNAMNRYFGFEYAYRPSGNRRFDIGFRYETNTAETARNHFTRWTYGAEYGTRLTPRDTLVLEARYRPKRFDERRIRVGRTRINRFDHNRIVSASWIHSFHPHLDFELGYRFESRASNDRESFFNEHSLVTGVTYHF